MKGILFLIFFVFFGITLVGGMNSGDQVYYALTRALVEEKTIYLNGYERYTFSTDYAISPLNGKILADREPGVSIISIPFYVLGKYLMPYFYLPYGGSNLAVTEESKLQMLTYLSPIFISAVCLLISYILLKHKLNINLNKALMTVLLAGFGTLLWKDAASFSRHTIVASAFLVIGVSLLSYFKSDEKVVKNKLMFLIGTMFGLASLTDYFSLLTAALALISLFLITKNSNGLLKAIVGMMPFLVIILVYNQLAFGRLLTSPHLYQGYFTLYKRNIIDQFRTPLQWGLYLNLFSYGPIPASAIKWALNDPEVNYQLGVKWATIWPFKGIFVQTPILFISVFAWLKLWRIQPGMRKALVILSIIVLSVLLPISVSTQFWSPNRYDTRHLLPIVPFLLLGIPFISKQYFKNWFYKIVIVLLSFISVLFGFQSSITNFAPNLTGEHRFSWRQLIFLLLTKRDYQTALLQSFPNIVNVIQLTILGVILYFTFVRPLVYWIKKV